MWFLNECLADNRAILKHILQINQAAIVHGLSKVIGIMKMNNALLVGFHYIVWKEHLHSQILRHFPSHVITLSRKYLWILVRVLTIYVLILSRNNLQYVTLKLIVFPDDFSLESIANILSCYTLIVGSH